jgi:muramoyltetrapeptide carboxypeptidase
MQLFVAPYIYANSDEIRFSMLADCLVNKSDHVIWPVRGGYGSARLLPKLAQMSRPRRAKWLIGYSDISAVQVFLLQSWGWPSLHGPTLSDVGKGLPEAVLSEVECIVEGHTNEAKYDALVPLNAAARTSRTVSGTVSGGNLKTLEALIGTPYALRGNSRILVFEDVGERAYAIDRMLVHARLSGLFRGARAVVFGRFTHSDEPNGNNLVDDVLGDFARSMRCPVLASLPIGHFPEARPLVLGSTGMLTLGANPTLSTGWRVSPSSMSSR